MELNADFSKRVAVHAARLGWTPSPIAGVERRMLDRIGDEVARATSIVRYAPNSHFSPHVHELGEEFLVLEGVFQDEHGDFPAGTYVRNPPQSRHKPGSNAGCVLFVKLRQFDPADRTPVTSDTKRMPMFPAKGRAGVETIRLYHDEREDVRLERWAPHADLAWDPGGGIEILVLGGSFVEAGETFAEQSWLRLPVGARLAAKAGPAGCRVWIKEGHLRHVPSAAAR